MDDTPVEVSLAGGNVGGAVRIGDTVRRPTGPWTPAVHGLLKHLEAAGLPGVPRVRGFDEQGREILDFLPGRTFDTETVGDDVLVQAMRWLRTYHDAVASYRPAGVVRWRTSTEELADGQIVCMHDFGAYNWVASAAGEFVGVIDWDMAGPGTPLDDIAFAAWNTGPVAKALPPDWLAARMRLMASAYGDVTPLLILRAIPQRARRSARVIRAGQLAGDPGMLNLAKTGEPARTERNVLEMEERIPAIAALL
jgi:hypothetical protein